MKVHKTLTVERVMEAVESTYSTCDNPGFCIACGADAAGCEPDAEGYECEVCGANKVYGAEQLLFMIA